MNCDIAHAILTAPLPELNEEQLTCLTVARSQYWSTRKRRSKTLWMVPEPWNGDIAHAPILFIGQNPSANSGEVYPRTSSSENFVSPADFEFFNGRFGTEVDNSPIADGTRVRLDDNTYPKTGNPFLQRIKDIASVIIGGPARPGIDYALTEAVRCKAPKVFGIHGATQTCARKHLKTTLALSGAQAIVCLGYEARAALAIVTKHEDPTDFPLCKPFALDEWDVLCLPHSSARGHTRSDAIEQAGRFHEYLVSKQVRFFRSSAD